MTLGTIECCSAPGREVSHGATRHISHVSGVLRPLGRELRKPGIKGLLQGRSGQIRPQGASAAEPHHQRSPAQSRPAQDDPPEIEIPAQRRDRNSRSRVRRAGGAGRGPSSPYEGAPATQTPELEEDRRLWVSGHLLPARRLAGFQSPWQFSGPDQQKPPRGLLLARPCSLASLLSVCC